MRVMVLPPWRNLLAVLGARLGGIAREALSTPERVISGEVLTKLTHKDNKVTGTLNESLPLLYIRCVINLHCDSDKSDKFAGPVAQRRVRSMFASFDCF